MGSTNTKDKYGYVAIFFHWLIALIIISQLAVGLYMVNIPLSLQKVKLFGWHKEFGMLILMLALVRISWRFSNIIPLLPSYMPDWQKLAARAAHFFLYVFMFAMPITGWLLTSATGFPVSFFGLFVFPDMISANPDMKFYLTEIHGWLAYGLIALIAVHAAAVVQHYVAFKDNLLKRMWP
jgi:cytochrome b561